MDCTYADFYDSLDQSERDVFLIINEYIEKHYPEYKAFCTGRPKKLPTEFILDYRKKPKVGKAICTLISEDGKLTMRVCFLSEMAYDVLLHQSEFSPKFRSNILAHTVCGVDKGCRSYGGHTPCPFRQNYFINRRVIKACPYPWVYLRDLDASDSDDIARLLDMQMNHMTQNPRDIKGSGYSESNAEKCGNVRIVTLNEADMTGASLPEANHIKNAAALERYASLYRLTYMSDNGGLWFYHDAYRTKTPFTQLPKGKYATVTLRDPLKFSANRVWVYMSNYLASEKIPISELNIDEQTAPAFLAKFHIENGEEYMTAYIPVGE
jgi:hypothetical protein